jgi:hypothetical protein
MSQKANSLATQLLVLVPTLALSAFLGQRGVPLGTRIGLVLGFGMILIAAVAAWQRRRHP